MSSNQIVVEPIGHVRSGRTEALDDGWDDVETSIHLDDTQFSADALAGLDTFSHIEVVFFFHLVPGDAADEGLLVMAWFSVMMRVIDRRRDVPPAIRLFA